MSKRNTQFRDFAKLLMDELTAQGDLLDLNRDYDESMIAKYEQVIAQRAYDLACHAVTYLGEETAWLKCKGYTASQIAENDIPDMTAWPELREADELS